MAASESSVTYSAVARGVPAVTAIGARQVDYTGTNQDEDMVGADPRHMEFCADDQTRQMNIALSERWRGARLEPWAPKRSPAGRYNTLQGHFAAIPDRTTLPRRLSSRKSLPVRRDACLQTHRRRRLRVRCPLWRGCESHPSRPRAFLPRRSLPRQPHEPHPLRRGPPVQAPRRRRTVRLHRHRHRDH
ncbi:hypothetical protein C8Q76DRAFT_787807 [Earliella scabrosa]|nr:hypothetical protein C8Q76DRAFT_787807 [Earliella scabrosa]